MITKALAFASKAHEGQQRKYTGEPYITHPIAVAEIVKIVTDDETMLCAALLHDTVEDTAVTLEQVEAEFGAQVAHYVEMLSDVSTPDDGNRAARKALDRAHTAQAHPDAKTIKLADLIHNSSSITQYDEKFAAIYMAEKRLLLEVLVEGHRELYEMAVGIVDAYYAMHSA